MGWMRPSIGEVESGVFGPRAPRSPRRANWSSTIRPVLSSQLDRRAISAARASRANLFQNDGPVKAALTRGNSAAIAALLPRVKACLLYTSDAADDLLCVD